MASLITRVYSNFRGCDMRGDEVSLLRSPDALNVWRDYKTTDSIRTRPDIELKEAFNNTVWGVFFYVVGNTEMMLVHCGTTLYKIVDGVRSVLYEGLNPRKSQAFVFNNIWFFKDGLHYLEYNGETIKEVVGTVPTTTIGRKPQGGGTQLHKINCLSNERINEFLADGVETDYYLDDTDIDSTRKPEVRINDALVESTEYEFNSALGKVTFKTAPPAPLTDGQDNVSIRFSKTVPGHRERIAQCTELQVFDNRVFFGGNNEYPNAIFHSMLEDPRYCADDDYINEGMDYAKVTGMVAGNNALWVFKEPSQANTTIFYHNPALSDTEKIFPSVHSSISIGCIGKAINFNDDIVFFSERGMEAINGDVTTEQVIAHRSSLVDRKMIAEEDYKDMILIEYEGYLFVIIGKSVYLADSRLMFQNENHYEYEWHKWDLSEKITSAIVYKGVLYLGSKTGVYTLTDHNADVYSYWTTPLDKFDAPQYQKTTNKRGCVVEAKGDLTVSAKTNGKEWEEIDHYENITDYFVVKKKFKKFKDIQLKFSSNTRFSLEQATLECFVGGYIKR